MKKKSKRVRKPKKQSTNDLLRYLVQSIIKMTFEIETAFVMFRCKMEDVGLYLEQKTRK